MTTPLSEELPPEIQSIAKGVWWLVLLRGILAVVFGVIALFAPGFALVAAAIVFGAFALVDGLTMLMHYATAKPKPKGAGWLLVQAIVSVLAGIAALTFPGLIATFGGLFILWTIVFYAIVHGVAGIMSASGTHGRARTFAIIGGILTVAFGIVFGILTLFSPAASLLSLIWVAGIWAIILGVMLIVAAIQVRMLVNKHLGGRAAPKVA